MTARSTASIDLSRPHWQLARLDTFGQAALVHDGEVSPAELVRAAFTRIEELDPMLGSVSWRAFDHALRAAGRVDRSLPMAGVPLLLKASTSYPGFPHVCGSRSRRSDVAAMLYPFAGALDAAGLIACGMTTMPEFGLMGSGEAMIYGPTRNPWNPSRSPGGSSSGSGAAVAAGLVPFAAGSDGGGSIRLPASHCGIVGFKPSRGWNLRARLEFRRRSVRLRFADGADDARHGLGRAISAPPAGPPDHAAKGAPDRHQSGGARRARAATRGGGGDARGRRLVRLLGSRGRGMPVADRPSGDAPRVRGHLGPRRRRGGGYRARPFPDMSIETLLEPWTLGLAAMRQEVSPEELAGTLAQFDRLDRQMAPHWQRFDLVLSPVADSAAPPIGLLDPTRDFPALAHDHFGHVNFTHLQNMGGFPAISLPLGRSETGLPIGVMFWGPRGTDDRLLDLGETLETAADWRDRWPPVVR